MAGKLRYATFTNQDAFWDFFAKMKLATRHTSSYTANGIWHLYWI